MPIEFKRTRAKFLDEGSVEEAEGLLEWLQTKPNAQAGLSPLSHLHTANLQVMMAAKTTIAAWPKNAELRAWLEPALKSEG